MGKYLVKRILHGLFSVICVVVIVMVLVYSLLDRSVIFAGDPNYSKQQNNARTTYEYSRYEAFGYVDYVNYSEYIMGLYNSGEIDDDTRKNAALIGRTPDKDSEISAEYIQKFTDSYQKQGYTVMRLDASVKTNGQIKDGGQPAVFAYRDRPLITRVVEYFTHMIFIDNVHYVPDETDIGKRGLTFTLYDPVYNPTGTEKKLAPAIIGNGTMHSAWRILYRKPRYRRFHHDDRVAGLICPSDDDLPDGKG